LPFGVGVAQVNDGLARKHGIMEGDVIVSINFQPIRQGRDVDAVLSKARKGQSLPVRIMRNGRSIFVALTVE